MWLALATPWQLWLSEQLRPCAPPSTELTSLKIGLTLRAKNARSSGDTLPARNTNDSKRW